MDNSGAGESTEELADRLQQDDETARASYEGPVGAGFWIRGLAHGIDTLAGVVLGVLSPLAGIFVLALFRAPGTVEQWLTAAKQTSAGGFLLSLLGVTAYHAISEYMGGASVGKLVCGLRVVGQDLGRMTMRSSTIRSLAFYIDGMFLGAVAYLNMSRSPANQRAGDRWARTIVLKRSHVPESIAFSGAETFFGILAGLACWGGFLVLTVVIRVYSS